MIEWNDDKLTERFAWCVPLWMDEVMFLMKSVVVVEWSMVEMIVVWMKKERWEDVGGRIICTLWRASE
jgi:hypothetical protein